MARPTNWEKRARQQAAFLEAYAQTGMVRRGIEAAGVNMSYHYRWLKDDPSYAERFAALEQQVVGETLGGRRPHPKGYKIKGARAEENQCKRETFLAALAKTGIVLDASRETGISAASFYNWFRGDPEFAARAAQILEETRELSQRIKAERTGEAMRDTWDDGRREAWGEHQRGAWTPEMRTAAGERARERMADPEYRKAWLEANSEGRGTPEARAANSERMKRLWSDPGHRAKYLAAIADEDRRMRLSEQAKAQWEALTPEQRAEKMRNMRRVFKGGHRLTKIEATVMLALNDRELPYFVHKPVGGYVADLLIPSLSLVIEADGCWHHAQRPESDGERDEVIRTLGYETLRLSEDEITAEDWTRLDAEIARLSQ
jgi:very-short-patch-repair endonuclease